jgi:hypothetical protein
MLAAWIVPGDCRKFLVALLFVLSFLLSADFLQMFERKNKKTADFVGGFVFVNKT